MSKRTWEKYERECAAKRRGFGKAKTPTTPQSILVQRMRTVPNRLKKYEPLDTRNFVDFSGYDEISISNIKEACEKFYDQAPGTCDVLLGDRGPSCYLTEQVANKKVYFVRFLEIGVAKESTEHQKDAFDTNCSQWQWQGQIYKRQNFASESRKDQVDYQLPQVPSTAFPKSVCIADLMHAAKLVKPPDVTQITLTLESYDITAKKWETCRNLTILKDNQKFAEGGFRNAFLATSNDQSVHSKWVIKETKEDMMSQVTHTFNITLAEHTRKQVQMNAVARSIAMSFRKKAPENFGECFHYKKVFFSRIEDTPVTIEEYIPGTFTKYLNNNGLVIEAISEDHKIIVAKAECFVHYSFEATKDQIMVLDIQGVRYNLCDPEIASTVLLEDEGELSFCAGNLSTHAIDTFFTYHKCNEFCKMMNWKDRGNSR